MLTRSSSYKAYCFSAPINRDQPRSQPGSVLQLYLACAAQLRAQVPITHATMQVYIFFRCKERDETQFQFKYEATLPQGGRPSTFFFLFCGI